MNTMIWGKYSHRLLTWATGFCVVVQASAQLALPPAPPIPPPTAGTNNIRFAPIKPPQVIASVSNGPVALPVRPATATSGLLPTYLQQAPAGQPGVPARPT